MRKLRKPISDTLSSSDEGVKRNPRYAAMMPPRKAEETAGNSARGAGRPTTISDVALAAGVSVGTASKALNGRGSLRQETRHRVLSAAEQLGFQPNKAAVALNSGRTYTVGMITT